MREIERKTIEKLETKEITTQIKCDHCNKEIEEGSYYISLFIGSPYPECDGDAHELCSINCLSEYIETLDIEDFYSTYNSIETYKFKIPNIQKDNTDEEDEGGKVE